MRIPVVTLGLVALISTGSVAQSPEKLVVTPAAPFGPRLDFGLERAQKNLPQAPWRLVKLAPKHTLPMQPSRQIDVPAPVDCEMVKIHRHELLPVMRAIKPPATVHHHLKIVPVAPCPVR